MQKWFSKGQIPTEFLKSMRNDPQTLDLNKSRPNRYLLECRLFFCVPCVAHFFSLCFRQGRKRFRSANVCLPQENTDAFCLVVYYGLSTSVSPLPSPSSIGIECLSMESVRTHEFCFVNKHIVNFASKLYNLSIDNRIFCGVLPSPEREID